MYSRNQHNIVNQLFSNKFFFFFKLEERFKINSLIFYLKTLEKENLCEVNSGKREVKEK